jgi:hypothetical protein
VGGLIHGNDGLLPIITDRPTNFQINGFVVEEDTTIELSDAHVTTSVRLSIGL